MVSPLDRVGGGEVGRGGKPSHKGITLATNSALHGVGGGGKVARASESGQVSVARAVHSNPVGPLTAVCETSAAQVSGIDQRRTGCIEFGYERIGEGVAVSTTLHRL